MLGGHALLHPASLLHGTSLSSWQLPEPPAPEPAPGPRQRVAGPAADAVPPSPSPV